MLMLAGAHRLPGQLTSPFHSSVLLPFFSAPFSICVMDSLPLSHQESPHNILVRFKGIVKVCLCAQSDRKSVV